MNPDVHLASVALSSAPPSYRPSDTSDEADVEEPMRLNDCNWILMYLLGSLGGFAAYSYSPCLPTIQADLGTDQFSTSLALIVNWIARGFGSFFLGYLSDYTGRKWMIFVGLQMIIVGAYFCSEADDIFQFVVTIIIQGFGEGASSLVSPILAETYPDVDKYRHQGIVGTIQNFSLAVGPAIGGIITRAASWRWVFRTIYIWSMICMFLTCFLPETNKREERKQSMWAICDNFCSHMMKELLELFRREYISGLIFFTLYNAIIYLFLSTLAFVFEDYYHMSAWESGLFISIIAGGALFGMIVSVWGVGEKDSPAITHLSDMRWSFGVIGLMVVVGSWIVVITKVYDDSDKNSWIVATVLGVMMFFLNCVTLSYSAIQHRPFHDKYGTSIGFSAMFTLILATTIALPFVYSYEDSPVLIMESITVIFSILWLSFWITLGIPGLPEGYWDDSDENWEGRNMLSSGVSNAQVQPVVDDSAIRGTMELHGCY